MSIYTHSPFVFAEKPSRQGFEGGKVPNVQKNIALSYATYATYAT